MTPPGSVKLIGQNGKIISYPKPTDDYDDPLVSPSSPARYTSFRRASLTDGQNWSFRRKAIHFGIILIYVGVTFASVDLSLLRDSQLAIDLSMNASQLAVSTAFRYIGMALTAALFIPFAYKYGRRPVYLLSLLIQLAAAIWMGLVRHTWEYRAANLLTGAGAVVAQALMPMTITDLFFTHQFASAYGAVVFAQGVGCFVGPMLTSEIVSRHGGDWRWMPWAMAATFGATAVLVFFGVEESTFVPNIDNQVAAKTRQEEAENNFYNRPVSYAAPRNGTSPKFR